MNDTKKTEAHAEAAPVKKLVLVREVITHLKTKTGLQTGARAQGSGGGGGGSGMSHPDTH